MYDIKIFKTIQFYNLYFILQDNDYEIKKMLFNIS